jgi:hypothetical protein
MYFTEDEDCIRMRICENAISNNKSGVGIGDSEHVGVTFVYQNLLTWPLTRGFLLLVSFSLSKATTPCAIQS